MTNVRQTSHLALAVRKWGAEVFSREIICYASCQQEADLLEQFFIRHYQSADRRYGYNNELGGLRGALSHSDASKKRISKSLKAFWAKMSAAKRKEVASKRKLMWRSRTQEERQRIIEPMRLANIGKRSPFKGKKRPEVSNWLRTYHAGKKLGLPRGCRNVCAL